MGQIRQLSFTFHFENPDHSMPTGIEATPDLNDLHDNVILMLSAMVLKILTRRHGLEQALKMVEDTAYGRIGDDTKFAMTAVTLEEEEFPPSWDSDAYNTT